MGSLENFNNKCVDISILQSKYGFDTMIETGCFNGATLDYMSNFDFLQEIYSCDIELAFSEYCERKFRNNPKIKIYNQSSQDFLTFILPQLENKDSILFWLDAHFYKPYIPNYNDIDYPLLKELEIISTSRKGKKDVIVIDDVYTYVESPENYRNALQIEKVGLDSIKKYGYNVDFYKHDKGYLLLST